MQTFVNLNFIDPSEDIIIWISGHFQEISVKYD